MLNIYLSKIAATDAEAIWLSLAMQNIEKADFWLVKLDVAFRRLDMNPANAQSVILPNCNGKALSSTFGTHVIYFRIRSQSLEILRIMPVPGSNTEHNTNRPIQRRIEKPTHTVPSHS